MKTRYKAIQSHRPAHKGGLSERRDQMDLMKGETKAEKKRLSQEHDFYRVFPKKEKVKNKLKSPLLCGYILANKVMDLE